MDSPISFIEKTLQEASQIARNYFGNVSSTVKQADNNQVLTKADTDIGNLIVLQISTTYPNHSIIDEEAGVIDKNSEYTWIIDPIDGTSNFANGLPHYGIMIGLLKGEIPVAGGVVLPFFNEIILAEKGKGAFKNGTKICVTDEIELKNILLAYGIDGHPENQKLVEEEVLVLGNIINSIRNLRTSNSVYDAVCTADGRYGGYINKTMKIWDMVPIHLLLEESGAICTDYLGNKIDYSQPTLKVQDNFTICAAPKEIHSRLQSIIKRS